ILSGCVHNEPFSSEESGVANVPLLSEQPCIRGRPGGQNIFATEKAGSLPPPEHRSVGCRVPAFEGLLLADRCRLVATGNQLAATLALSLHIVGEAVHSHGRIPKLSASNIRPKPHLCRDPDDLLSEADS